MQHATAFGHCAHHFAGEGLIDELVRPDKMVGGLFATSLLYAVPVRVRSLGLVLARCIELDKRHCDYCTYCYYINWK